MIHSNLEISSPNYLQNFSLTVVTNFFQYWNTYMNSFQKKEPFTSNDQLPTACQIYIQTFVKSK